jgi:hypothetical protein
MIVVDSLWEGLAKVFLKGCLQGRLPMSRTDLVEITGAHSQV